MKKYLLCFAIAAVAFASCNKDNGTNGGNKVKDLEATFKMETGLASLVYAEPVDIVGAAASESRPDGCTLVAVKKSGETYIEVGEAQDGKVDGDRIAAQFFADSKEMTDIAVTLKAGNAQKTFYCPVGKVTGELKGTVWMNDAVALYADAKVATHDNDPENYPVEGTGAGSDTKSFFSMHGVKIGDRVEHVLSLDQMRAVDGLNGSMCFLNCLQNTKNNAYIGGQRGYMFSFLKASGLGGGTTGRQCDLYEVDGHGIKDANVDVKFEMRLVRGSWKSDYDAEFYAGVDAIFIKIKNAGTPLEKMRAFWQLGEIQRMYDNSTLGEEDPDKNTNLGGQTFQRRWLNAGHTGTASAEKNIDAGDYMIIKSTRGTDDAPSYYYGIIQILQFPDDKDVFTVNDAGRTYIDKDLAQDLFMKPVYLDIKTQCEIID